MGSKGAIRILMDIDPKSASAPPNSGDGWIGVVMATYQAALDRKPVSIPLGIVCVTGKIAELDFLTLFLTLSGDEGDRYE
jgi:hypothetical protein